MTDDWPRGVPPRRQYSYPKEKERVNKMMKSARENAIDV